MAFLFGHNNPEWRSPRRVGWPKGRKSALPVGHGVKGWCHLDADEISQTHEECLLHLLGRETKAGFQSCRGNRKEIAERNEELSSSAKIFKVHLHKDFYLQNVIVDRHIVSGYLSMEVCYCCVHAHTCMIPRVIGTSVGMSGK